MPAVGASPTYSCKLFPTCAGLDSFAALSVMGYLQEITSTNQQTLIATIHQPRDAIWEMFDKVRLPRALKISFVPCLPLASPKAAVYLYLHMECAAACLLDLSATFGRCCQHVLQSALAGTVPVGYT